MHHPTDRIAHTTAFVIPVVEHWLEWEKAQWVHHMKDVSNDPSHHEPLPRSYISLHVCVCVCVYVCVHYIHTYSDIYKKTFPSFHYMTLVVFGMPLIDFLDLPLVCVCMCVCACMHVFNITINYYFIYLFYFILF